MERKTREKETKSEKEFCKKKMFLYPEKTITIMRYNIYTVRKQYYNRNCNSVELI